MNNLRKPGSPAPREVQLARQGAGLNTDEAGALVHVSGRTMEDYEQGRYSMPPDRWESLEYKLSVLLSESEQQHHRDQRRRMRKTRPSKLARIVNIHFGPPRTTY